jgi:hypothetical protein
MDSGGVVLAEVDFVGLFDACRPGSILSQNRDTKKNTLFILKSAMLVSYN